MFQPGEISQRVLNTHFFTQESKQLHLTPELAEKFNQVVHEQLSQFEEDVNGLTEGFVSFLQRAHSDHRSEREVSQALNKAQGAINQVSEQFLSRIHALLLENTDSNTSAAVTQFVQDIQSQIAPSTNLEAMVRNDPKLSRLMPSRSIFDLAATPKVTSKSSDVAPTKMDQRLAQAYAWLNTPGLSSADKALAQQLIDEIKSLGHSDTNLAQLQAWGVNMSVDPKGPYSTASGGSSGGQAQFTSILGIPQRTPAVPPSARDVSPNQPPPSDMFGFLKALQRQQAVRMVTQFGIESILSLTAQQSKVSVMPNYIEKIANKMMDTTHLHIAGYSPDQTVGQGVPPAQPLQTNAWWTLLADDRGAGSLSLKVIADSDPVTDPKSQIRLSDAQLFNKDAQVGQAITVSYNLADNYNPNINQGAYNVQSYDGAFSFNPSEQYQVVSNGTSAYAQNTPYLMVEGAKESLIFPPTVVGSDDNSVSLVYQTRTGGSMTVPLVRGSPYLTFQYQNATPYFNTTAYPIDMETITAYYYKVVVADNTPITDPTKQISSKDAKAFGLDGTVGAVDLVQNTDGPPWTGKAISGQVFSYKTVDSGTTPGDTYRLYFSSPVTLNPCDYVTETVVPNDVPLSDHYVHPDPNDPPDLQKPYATKQVNMYSDSKVATGLEASGPFNGTARIIKVPSSVSSAAGGSSLMDATLQEINAILARGGNMGDLRLWAATLLSDQNFLQDYPNISPEDFYEFCSLTGTDQMDAENRLAAKWQALSKGGDQNWQKIANQLAQLTNPASGNAATVQQWIQNVINGKDPTFSPLYQSLNSTNQKFLQIFAQFGRSTIPPETNLNKDAALAAYQKTQPDLHTQTLNLFDTDAWNIPLSGHYNSTGLGKWNYTYVTDNTVNPYAGLGLKYTPGKVLIGLLKTDFSYLDGTNVFSSKAYLETIKGELEFAETSNNQLNFYDKDATLSWPDDDLDKLAPSDQIDLANKYLNDVLPNLFLNDRHLNEATYGLGKDLQNAADIAHALWKLSHYDSIKNAPGGLLQAVQQGAIQAAHIAEAGLDDFLTGGLLEYDQTNGMIVSKFGQSLEGEDYNNANGEDHHFAYGYLIRAAAEIRQVDPSWFQDPKWGTQRTQMVNFLVDDVFNVQNNPNFPRMRMWDPYIGIGRATGLVTPSGNGMNEESTAEDYNCIQGIAMWAQTDGNVDLQNQAATMAERVKNAAQAYWQTHSSTSIYTDDYAPDAAKEFASKVVTCGINWDNEASSATFFLPSADADHNIFALAIEFITGNANLVDYKEAQAAFDYLVNQKDASGYPRILQYNMQPPNPSFTTYIPILIPLIAQVSPTAAKALLDWFQQASTRQPGVYMYDAGCNYATIYQQILMASKNSTHKDPFTPPMNLPPLPEQNPYPSNAVVILNGSARYYLSPFVPPDGDFAKVMPLIDAEAKKGVTPDQLAQWIHDNILPKFPSLHVGDFLNLYYVYTHLSASGQAMMAAFQAQTDQMIKDKNFSILALQEWLQNQFLPTVKQKYPGINAFDIETFCKMAQIDIHSFD